MLLIRRKPKIIAQPLFASPEERQRAEAERLAACQRWYTRLWLVEMVLIYGGSALLAVGFVAWLVWRKW